MLAPGPSATAGQAELLCEAGIPLGVVGSAFQLAKSPAFIAASDSAWWRRNPEAKATDCKRFTMHTVSGAATIRVPGMGVCNSGVLALECAKREGATRILLVGFDMHGSHFFGPYTNGLSNTTEAKRKVHLRQYAHWAKANVRIQVLNCTEGSALTCFPTARLEDGIADFLGQEAESERIRAA